MDFLWSRSGRSAALCPGHHLSTGGGGIGLQEPILRSNSGFSGWREGKQEVVASEGCGQRR